MMWGVIVGSWHISDVPTHEMNVRCWREERT